MALTPTQSIEEGLTASSGCFLPTAAGRIVRHLSHNGYHVTSTPTIYRLAEILESMLDMEDHRFGETLEEALTLVGQL